MLVVASKVTCILPGHLPEPVLVRDEFLEPAFTPLIVDASEDEVDSGDLGEPELYTPGELPRPRFVMLGQQESILPGH